MIGAGCIGVLGGYGQVGRAAVAQLAAWGESPVIVGGRHPERAVELPGAADIEQLDVNDPVPLARFCRRCHVVVNCAGPSSLLLDRVAKVAWRSGADYVDAGGDDGLFRLLSGGNGAEPHRTAVLSAGLLPGLTGLLPRILSVDGIEEPSGLVGYVGGLDRFTLTAATDYAASVANGFGQSRAAWRDGHRVERVLSPVTAMELPFFKDPVAAHPYLSTEMERAAASLNLRTVTFYNVFAGPHLGAALGQLAGDGRAMATRLVEASELDTFGRDCYQRLVFQLDGTRRGHPETKTVVLSGSSAGELTATMVAMATVAITAGGVPPGVHFAADVVDPQDALARLRGAAAVVGVEVFDRPIVSDDDDVEEGAF